MYYPPKPWMAWTCALQCPGLHVHGFEPGEGSLAGWAHAPQEQCVVVHTLALMLFSLCPFRKSVVRNYHVCSHVILCHGLVITEILVILMPCYLVVDYVM